MARGFLSRGFLSGGLCLGGFCLGCSVLIPMVPRKQKALLEELDTHYNLSSFLESYEKMADVDMDPFGNHDKTDLHPDDAGETIPLTPGGGAGHVGRGSTWEPEHEQERSFRGGKTQERRLTDSYVDSLYKELSKHYNRTSDATHYDNYI